MELKPNHPIEGDVWLMANLRSTSWRHVRRGMKVLSREMLKRTGGGQYSFLDLLIPPAVKAKPIFCRDAKIPFRLVEMWDPRYSKMRVRLDCLARPALKHLTPHPVSV